MRGPTAGTRFLWLRISRLWLGTGRKEVGELVIRFGRKEVGEFVEL